MRKIGIMGGTFNPIHIAHMILAESAYEQFKLDKILFMPSKNPPHKRHENIVSDEHRVQMVELAIQNNPHFELSKVEIEREGITYTAETLQILTQKNPDQEYYFIIGGDSLFQMEHWMSPDIIFSLCHVIAAGRDNVPEQKVLDHIKFLTNNYDAQIHYLNVPNMDVSSNYIRQIRKVGRSIRYYVPELVEQYIREHQLYLDPET